jgi:hypothetical protein
MFVLMVEVETLGVAGKPWLEGAHEVRQGLSREHKINPTMRLS